jgi:hypothetical protein
MQTANSKINNEKTEKLFNDLISDFKKTQIYLENNKRIEESKSKNDSILDSGNAALLEDYTEQIYLLNKMMAKWFYEKGFFDAIENATEYIMYS